MLCEPNFNLPQKIDLEVLRLNSDKSESHDKAHKDSIEWREALRPKISYIQKEYNVLPKFYDQYNHLNTVLSLKDNPYLCCRWDAFLNHVPENYVRTRLYMDYQKEKEVFVVKRKILNGHFYGIDNKLAPIPTVQ